MVSGWWQPGVRFYLKTVTRQTRINTGFFTIGVRGVRFFEVGLLFWFFLEIFRTWKKLSPLSPPCWKPHKYWLFWVTVFSSNLSLPVTNLSQPVTNLSLNSPISNGQAISKGDDSYAHSFIGLHVWQWFVCPSDGYCHRCSQVNDFGYM